MPAGNMTGSDKARAKLVEEGIPTGIKGLLKKGAKKLPEEAVSALQGAVQYLLSPPPPPERAA